MSVYTVRSLCRLSALCVLVSACGDGDINATDSETGSEASSASNSESDTHHGGSDSGGAGYCDQVDLLFVIDESPTMANEQDTLTSAFPEFIATIDQELAQKRGVSYRVGVLSADMTIGRVEDSSRGRLRHMPDRLPCTDTPSKHWIEPGPIPTISAQFQCIASMESFGFIETPLEALRAGLVDRVEDTEAYNAGFLRPDAVLFVMFVTDEDDQSSLMWDGMQQAPPTPVQTYWDLLLQLKGGDPDKLVLTALSGPASTGCSMPGSAEMAPRVHELLALAPHSLWGSLCADEYSTQLGQALDLIDATCQLHPD
ncbi:MAG: hypothetical protein ACPG4T_13310 [Nannocystaceae bacterium]